MFRTKNLTIFCAGLIIGTSHISAHIALQLAQTAGLGPGPVDAVGVPLALDLAHVIWKEVAKLPVQDDVGPVVVNIVLEA